jgi:hypothetical protein
MRPFRDDAAASATAVTLLFNDSSTYEEGTAVSAVAVPTRNMSLSSFLDPAAAALPSPDVDVR